MADKRILAKRIRHPEGIVSVSPAGEGYSIFRVSGGKYGFLDPRGKVISPPVWMSVRPFSDGLAAVRGDKGWGYINTRGEVVLPAVWYAASPFREGRALVTGGGKRMMIDRAGKRVIAEGKYVFCDGFREGRAVIGRRNRGSDYMQECDLYGYMDISGNAVIKPRWDECMDFSDGLAAVRKGKLWGFVDRDGNVVVRPKWEHVSNFHEGRAIVLDSGFSLGMIDSRGKLVIPLYYSCLGNFCDGLAPFGQCGKHGFLDRAGKVVIPAQWDECQTGSFGGLRAVRLGEKWKLLSRSGRIVMDDWDELCLSGNANALGRRNGDWWLLRIEEVKELPAGDEKRRLLNGN